MPVVFWYGLCNISFVGNSTVMIPCFMHIHLFRTNNICYFLQTFRIIFSIFQNTEIRRHTKIFPPLLNINITISTSATAFLRDTNYWRVIITIICLQICDVSIQQKIVAEYELKINRYLNSPFSKPRCPSFLASSRICVVFRRSRISVFAEK